jgi:hypothetical protein
MTVSLPSCWDQYQSDTDGTCLSVQANGKVFDPLHTDSRMPDILTALSKVLSSAHPALHIDGGILRPDFVQALSGLGNHSSRRAETPRFVVVDLDSLRSFVCFS